jgi:arginase
MSTAPPLPQVALLGAALDLGQGRRGVDMGPSAIRYADLVGRLAELGLGVHDLGTVAEHPIEALAAGDDHAKYLAEILDVCGEIAGHVEARCRAGELPLVLGGDHSLALGVFGGLARVHGPVAVIWFDAHADCNTPETTPSGNVHGMGLSGALGWGGERFADGRWPLPSVDEERTVLIGVRSLDPGEKELLRTSRVQVYTMSEVDRLGMEAVIRGALEHVRPSAHVHVSLDMDVMDPFWAPGVGTAVRGGISYREAHLAMELLAEARAVGSLEVVEVNPVLDRENMTGQLAVELICSALGQRIL